MFEELRVSTHPALREPLQGGDLHSKIHENNTISLFSLRSLRLCG